MATFRKPCSPARGVVIAGSLWLLLGSAVDPAGAADILEDFESYPEQLDTTGVFNPDENDTSFLVTPLGTLPEELDPALIVAAVSESLRGSASIAAEGENQYWVLGAQAGASVANRCGPGSPLGFILNGTFGYAGPFGLFATPQDLSAGSVSMDVRAGSAEVSTSFRFLLLDENDNERWTEPFPLTTMFQTFTAQASEFTVLPGDQHTDFDIRRIVFVGLDLCTTSGGDIPAMAFHVDNARVSVSEATADVLPTLELLLLDDE
jgi:hypothetical protein